MDFGIPQNQPNGILSAIMSDLDDNIQLSRENIALKKEIEMLKSKISGLESRNSSLMRKFDSTNEKLLMANIKIESLTNKIKDLEKDKKEMTLNLSKSIPSTSHTSVMHSSEEGKVESDGEITESDIENLFMLPMTDESENEEANPKRKRRTIRKENIKYLSDVTEPKNVFDKVKMSNSKEEIIEIVKDTLIESYSNVTLMKEHISTIVNTTVIWLKDYGEKDEKTNNFVIFLTALLKYVSPQALPRIKEIFVNSKRIYPLFELEDNEYSEYYEDYSSD